MAVREGSKRSGRPRKSEKRTTTVEIRDEIIALIDVKTAELNGITKGKTSRAEMINNILADVLGLPPSYEIESNAMKEIFSKGKNEITIG